MPRAGLDAAVVTAAAADLADELGLPALSMSVVAERLGVKAPSLYKHVAGLDDLVDRVGALAATEIATAVGRATQGRSGSDALTHAADAFRSYVRQHAGRYAATVGPRDTAADAPTATALRDALDPFSAVLRGYHLPEADHVHALRALRSILHGFTTLETGGGFQLGTDVDQSFTWLVALLDTGLRSTGSTPRDESAR
ncbi:TetR-like C-terminal domain-containing protein [Amnibacterium endophyticum]|uniref:TetR-like C-terminal domain-containing protein n=1 Tax=Amnibacterium endophyticum TaxID=2109337 RepID=A0ABW4LFP8_9MICO